jgi:hypothetical protein
MSSSLIIDLDSKLISSSIFNNSEDNLNQISKQLLNKKKTLEKWTYNDDINLRAIKNDYINISWDLISEKLDNKFSPFKCKMHWNYSCNPKIKKGKFTNEEDKLIKKYVEIYGDKNWKKIENFIPNRTKKQIRERYINYIKMEKKNFIWNKNLEKKLIEYYLLYNGSWVKISKIFDIAENILKNRFYSLLRQIIHKLQKKNIVKNSIELNEINNPKKYEKIFLEKNNFFESEISNKELVLNNPYFLTSSKKKNFTLKILLQFLPDLLYEYNIDIEKLKKINQNRQIGITHIFYIISNHIYNNFFKEFNDNKNEHETELIKICNSKEGCSKSSILLNMQLNQLSGIVENAQINLLKMYFYKFKKQTLGI